MMHFWHSIDTLKRRRLLNTKEMIFVFLRLQIKQKYIISSNKNIQFSYQNTMFGIVKNFASGLFLKNSFKFSAGYFSHRPTSDNNDSTPFDFTEDNYKQVYKILDKYPPNWKRSAIIPLLHLAQKQSDNFLSLNAMKTIAKICEVNEMDVYQTASFYTMFNREKVGKYHLQVCGTTPCQLRGSEKIIEACEKHLGIKSGQTTPDYMYTIQEVECLGACANAPMIQVNGEWVYEDLTPESTVQLLQNLKNGTDKKGPQTDRNDCEGPQGRTTLKGVNLQEEVRFDRDFSKAKQDWEQAEKKRVEEEKRKAEEAKRLQEERKKRESQKV